jgi:carbamoyltransferase
MNFENSINPMNSTNSINSTNSKNSITILGISAYYHDSAAALIRDGEIIAAAQEERFSRVKHDPSFPNEAIEYCLEEAKTDLKSIDYIVFYDKPFLKFERLLETYVAEAPKGIRSFLMAIPLWLKEKLFLKNTIIRELRTIQEIQKKILNEKIYFTEHHQAHSASAFYPSPYDEAAILTIDGVGEWSTTSLAYGKGNDINILKEIHFPYSLGLLYSAFTYYTGFKVNSGEYKVMGLAPYGEPKYVQLIKDNLIDIKDDGSFRMNLEYFNYTAGLTMTNRKFDELFGGKPRKSESVLTQKDMDLARSIQEITDEIMLKLSIDAKKETGSENLCLAGGVALNCVSNGKVLKNGIFKNIWIQPAAGDAGGALGAALSMYYQELGKERKLYNNQSDTMKGALLGPSYNDEEIMKRLDNYNAIYYKIEDDRELYEIVTDALMDEKVIGWHQGRMEFGPRALGNRSIIGDARSPKMQSIMNLKIKYRESFRPFAPSVLRDKLSEYFEMDYDSPYMLLVADVNKELRKEINMDEKQLFGIDKLNLPRTIIPAVTHIDYSARIQTVHEDINPRYYRLIKRFEEKSGCAVIINTSFNVRGEPIVCSPTDSYKCFMRTEMDLLVIGNFILYKQEQSNFDDKEKWMEMYELD